MDQRLAISGFNSPIFDIRVFADPLDGGRRPTTITIYYSTLSTTSLNSADSNYTGANGGVLLSATALSAASFDHPVAGANSSYVDLFVNAPVGTRTVLIDLGAANGRGDRLAEVQAFAAPEPSSLALIGAALFIAGCRRRR